MSPPLDYEATPAESIELGELACWRIRHAGAELIVARQGAQLLSYRREGEPPLLWLSEEAAYLRGGSVRGGMPICWPWFGDLQRNPPSVRAMAAGAAPFHGLARVLDWQLDAVERSAADVRVGFRLAIGQGLPGWPHRVEPHLELVLGDGLDITLRNRNLGTEPVALSQALHTYFAVSDIRAVSVEGLQGCRYLDTIDDWQQRHQLGALRFSGETDRIFLDVPPRIELRDAGWRRAIALQADGSRSAIVWNPWADKARRLSQCADDAWQRMLCIETANVLDDSLLLAPGEERTLCLRLVSAPLG